MLWGLCCILAFLTGVFFLKFLTTHPLRMSLYLKPHLGILFRQPDPLFSTNDS